MQLNEAIKLMNDDKLEDLKMTEDKSFKYVSPFGDPNNKTPINKLIDNIKNTLDKKYKTRFGKIRTLSDSINDKYVKITEILKHDIQLREKYGNTTTVKDVYMVNIYDSKKKKYYKFTYADLFVPFQQIEKMIYDAMQFDKINSLKGVKAEVDRYLDEYYWYIFDTTTIIRKSEASGTIDQYLEFAKNNIDNCFFLLYKETNIISMEIAYLSYINKSHYEIERKYGNDKEAMKIINDIFSNCIKYTQKAIEFNEKGSDYLEILYNNYAKSIEDVYKLFKR